MSNCGVYKMWHTEKPYLFYIGVTKRSFSVRQKTHYSDLRNGKHYNKRLQSIVSKYGMDGLRFETIISIPESAEVSTFNLLEYLYIQSYLHEYGEVYNVIINNSYTPRITEEGRDRISERMKKNNPMLCPSIRQKMADTRKQLYPASKVRQYTLDGDLVGVWNNVEDAAKHNNVDVSNIYRACRNNRICQDHIFIYDEEYDIDILREKIRFGQSKPDCSWKNGVSQYTLDGVFVQHFQSASMASKSVNVDESNIVRAANGVNNSSGGHIWIYNDKYTDEILASRVSIAQERKVRSEQSKQKTKQTLSSLIHQVNPKTGKIINTHESAKHAAKSVNTDPSNISRAATGSAKSSAGYIWIYEKDYSEQLKKEKLDKFWKRLQ